MAREFFERRLSLQVLVDLFLQLFCLLHHLANLDCQLFNARLAVFDDFVLGYKLRLNLQGK